MTDSQLLQFDGTVCGTRNCAAASGAMAVRSKTRDADQITPQQFRNESGRSCDKMDPPDATHSRSGGLYIGDVVKVCAAHGVQIVYARDQTIEQLRANLALGGGAVVLGDCQDAPIQPTPGVVYHSLWVHGFRDGDDTTHMHDPRLTSAHWVTLAAVERYWRSGAAAEMWAGSVADVAQPDAGLPPAAGGEMDHTITTDAAGAEQWGGTCQAGANGARYYRLDGSLDSNLDPGTVKTTAGHVRRSDGALGSIIGGTLRFVHDSEAPWQADPVAPPVEIPPTAASCQP